MSLTFGQMVGGRYRIETLLGQGGMSAVYKAWDTRLNVPVALKKMVPQPGISAKTLIQLREQFQQEAGILARLRHPHLARVTDYFIEENNAYLVMDLIEGKTLAFQIYEKGAIPEEEVLLWAQQLLEVLSYCHGKGVIHRDIKPQNAIIQPNGHIILVDFGLVKLWDPQDPRTRTAMRGAGTPEYAPPEQYDVGTHTGPRADIYSLGATLYHALTGQIPPTATQRAASRTAFKKPRILNPNISQQTEQAILRAMELMTEDRFASAEEMAAALKKEATPKPKPKPNKQSRKELQPTRLMDETISSTEKKRLPIWIWGVGAVAMLALLIGIGMGIQNSAKPTDTPTVVITSPSSTPEPTKKLTTTLTRLPSSTATTRPTNTSTPKPAASATPKLSPSATTKPTSTPAYTATPSQVPSPTERPTATRAAVATQTPAPVASSPILVAPSPGATYKNLVTFTWNGSLNTGQTYQVILKHANSGTTLQSELLTTTSWTKDLPAENYGEWQWSVVVIQDGRTITTSPTWVFYIDPGFGPGDNGTSAPPLRPTNTPSP